MSLAPSITFFNHQYLRHTSFACETTLNSVNPSRQMVQSCFLRCFRQANVLCSVPKFDHLIISRIAHFLFANVAKEIDHMTSKHISLFTPAHFQRLSALARNEYFWCETQFELTLNAYHKSLHDLLQSNFDAYGHLGFGKKIRIELPNSSDLLLFQ